jgi:putative acetyltransferase
MNDHQIAIERADTPEAFAAARELITEYGASLKIDLTFQGFQRELDELQTYYGPPDGALFLARDSNGFCGCIGVRRFDALTCEMKRLYVQDRTRGFGVGRLLAHEAISFARRGHYERMILDSLPTMTSAIRLYRNLGFKQIAPYYRCPIEGTVYMALRLEPSA